MQNKPSSVKGQREHVLTFRQLKVHFLSASFSLTIIYLPLQMLLSFISVRFLSLRMLGTCNQWQTSWDAYSDQGKLSWF